VFCSFCSRSLKLVLALLILVSFTATGFAIAHKKVTIKDGSNSMVVSTFAGDVKTLLEQEGVKLGPCDTIVPGLNDPIKDGSTIRINRGFTVTIVADGKKRQVTTGPKKVKDILEAAGIVLGSEDIVRPAQEFRVEEETTIEINCVTKKQVVVDKKIPYKTVRQPDRTLEKGIERIKQRGIEGIERQVFEVTYVDGKEKDRRLISSKVVKEPRPKIVALGTISLASRGGAQFRFKRVITAVATAYTYTGRPTATGIRPSVGTVAVDPDVIPLGSRLYIEGYGFGVAQDIGSGINGNRVDVFLETREAALRWGRKRVKVYILE